MVYLCKGEFVDCIGVETFLLGVESVGVKLLSPRTQDARIRARVWECNKGMGTQHCFVKQL